MTGIRESSGPTLFWDVDTQTDFLSPQGRLYVPGAETIVPNLIRLTAWARDHRVLIVASADAHLPGDAELATYGLHCMAGTPGQQKANGTVLPRHFVFPNRPVDSFPDFDDYQQLILEKQEFDVFTNPNTDAVLEWFGRSLRIVLYGVVTEICVSAAARGLLDRGHKVQLVQDAIRSLSPAQADAFLTELLDRGGTLTTTAEVTGAQAVPAR